MSAIEDVVNLMVVKKKLMGYVGFHNLPNQYHRKSIKQGFQFTLMVVGESGLGKSTLINTLFDTMIYPNKENVELSQDTPKTVEIQTISADLEENGVKLKLNCIDTPGFGDFVNNEESWRPILETIESRFSVYLEQENRVNRKQMKDTRVHACLYFISPTGHSLRPLDIEFMKKLCDKVNLIPLIAKSDTLTEEEIKTFKSRILADMEKHNIKYFIPETQPNDDPETIEETKSIVAKIPFAVVGTTREYKVGGKSVRGRQYPWGLIEIENEEHCDFVKLRHMLIRSHMEELKDRTNDILYEQFRHAKLSSKPLNSEKSGSADRSAPLSQFDKEREAHEKKMAKMEAEMKAVFQQKVAEKEAKLKQSEEELYARHREMKEQLERQKQDLEEKRRNLLSAKKKGGFFK